LEHLNLLSKRAKTPTKIAKNSKIFKAIIKAIQDKKGEDIVSLDLRKIPEAVADFFIICSAGSSPQCKAIADNIDFEVENTCGEKPFKQEGYQSLQWVLLDYVNIVIHIMQPSARIFYKLEDMWSDAEAIKHEE
jgi:ribosome-associated protein